MKWTILLAFAVAVATGCSKSNETPDALVNDNGTSITSAGEQKSSLVGSWRFVEYYQDRGDGTGQWIAATETEEVTFTETGEVRISGNSFLATRGYNRYRIIDANRVELSSTSNSEAKEIFYFNRESATDLIFNPLCRENCARRYKFVG
jgi:hypothetical protein